MSLITTKIEKFFGVERDIKQHAMFAFSIFVFDIDQV